MKPLSLFFTIFLLASAGLAHSNEPTLAEISLESDEAVEKNLLSLEEEAFSLQDPSNLLEENSPLLLIEGNNADATETPKLSLLNESLFPLEAEISVEEPTLKITQEEITEEPAEFLPNQGLEISLKQVFAGSPFIYSLLFSMSFFSIAIWLYSLARIKKNTVIPDKFYTEVRSRILDNQLQEASKLCEDSQNLFSRILSAGLVYRKYGLQAMLEGMKSEGKRSTISSWQRLNLLQDVAIIAPMLGLLGTVLGMFYAFYDLNRSFESIANLFDGLGISVGTTVAGIGVAILAMILHSIAKFRLIRALATIENRASSLAYLMEEKQ